MKIIQTFLQQNRSASEMSVNMQSPSISVSMMMSAVIQWLFVFHVLAKQLKQKCRPSPVLLVSSNFDLSLTMQKRIGAWLRAEDVEDMEQNRRKKTPPETLLKHWRRMTMAVFRYYVAILVQSAMDYLTSRNKGTMATLAPKDKSKSKAKELKDATKIRRGIGQPLPRSTASKTWPCEPSECAHEEDQLRQRGAKNSFWWTCLNCGSRWERLEWAPDQEINSGKGVASSSKETTGASRSTTVTASSSVAYPGRLPPPRSRPELATLVIEDKDQADFFERDPRQMMMGVPVTPPRDVPSAMTQGPIQPVPPQIQALMDLPADAQLEHMLKMKADKEARKLLSGVRPAQPRSKPRTPSGANRFTETHEICSSQEDEMDALEDFQMEPPQ